jgi:hypothetical protein
MRNRFSTLRSVAAYLRIVNLPHAQTETLPLRPGMRRGRGIAIR